MTSQELKEARQKMGLPQKELAKKTGIPWRTYQDRERGVSEIKGDFAKLIELLLEKHAQ